jgi:adenosine kinase
VSDVVVGADDAGAMTAHVHQADALGARLVFAPAQQIPAMSDEGLRTGLARAWLVVGNDYELEMIRERTGVTIDALRAHCVVAVTRGAQGSELHHHIGTVNIPAVPVEQVLDPTGAGDAYIAGLLRGLRAGLTLEVAGRMAALAGALAVGARGPQSHTFTEDEFRDRYRTAFGADLPQTPQPAS